MGNHIKKKLLIINQQQFGYHSDTYYYCKYLRNSFDICYICWDYNEKRIHLNGISVIYVSRSGNLALRNARFLMQVIREVKKRYQIHIIKYFRGCSLLKFLFREQVFLLDIRSSSVKKNKTNRLLYNAIMTTEAKKFKYVSVISNSLAQKIGFSKKAIILPLGAEVISPTKKNFEDIKLLYIGTLYNRNIDQTIKGFSKFYHEYKDKIQINYTIIGSGFTTEEKELKELVSYEKLEGCVKLTGQIPHDEIKPFFDVNNVGVSYIPKTDYFDVQPPTKTFEYLLSGMPVIATDTQENKAVINPKNGILINDTSESFYQGLVNIYTNRKRYNSDDIRSNSMQYTWPKIVANFNSVLDSLIKTKHFL